MTVLARMLRVLCVLLIMGGAGGVVAGAFAPWAIAKVLGVEVGVPGIFFATGGLCLAAALLVLLGARRWPLLCTAGAVLILMQVDVARVDVPRRVKSQIVGAQLGLFPINRLLDQFHIGDLQIGNWNAPDANLLGPGLQWTIWGGGLLLAGGLLGLPSDPAAAWIYGRVVRVRCPSCGKKWAKARGAAFCATCGTSLVPADRRPCDHCMRTPERGDICCAGCGHTLA